MTAPEGASAFDARYYTRYASTFTDERAQREAEIVATIGGLGPGRLVVDIGCGRGRLLPYLARTGARVRGLDVDADALALAAALVRASDLVETVELVCADVTQYVTDELADAACCFMSPLGYADAPGGDDAFLAGAAALLRPGATLILEYVNSFALARTFQAEAMEQRPDGARWSVARTWDLATGIVRRVHRSEDGAIWRDVSSRMYAPHEVVQALGRAGCRDVAVLDGATLRAPSLETPFLVFVASR